MQAHRMFIQKWKIRSSLAISTTSCHCLPKPFKLH